MREKWIKIMKFKTQEFYLTTNGVSYLQGMNYNSVWKITIAAIIKTPRN